MGEKKREKSLSHWNEPSWTVGPASAPACRVQMEFLPAAALAFCFAELQTKIENPKGEEEVAGPRHMEPQCCEWKDQVFLSWPASEKGREVCPADTWNPLQWSGGNKGRAVKNPASSSGFFSFIFFFSLALTPHSFYRSFFPISYILRQFSHFV